MCCVAVRRWQDIKKFGSVNQDPIFKSNSVPNPEMWDLSPALFCPACPARHGLQRTASWKIRRLLLCPAAVDSHMMPHDALTRGVFGTAGATLEASLTLSVSPAHAAAHWLSIIQITRRHVNVD